MTDLEINRYWKKIVGTMNEGLMMVGPDGTIVMVNKAFEELTLSLIHISEPTRPTT